MILYDENYNFLGMSEQTLNQLGYEDLEEFCTYHKDFAELFEKENGLIYNFENFSWIDFVLYGGTNKDKAIITTKNKEKIEVKIEISEIKIKDDILNMSKLFSVKLIEKAKLEENSTQNIQPPQINLSSILDNQNPNTDKETTEISINKPQKEQAPQDDLDINLSFIKNEELKEDSKTTTPSISLDFLKSDNDTSKNEAIKTVTPAIQKESIDSKKEQNQDVVLNFFNSTIDEDSDSNIDIQDTIDTKNEKPIETDLNFLKEDSNETDKDIENQTEQNSPQVDNLKPLINLDFFKTQQDSDEKDHQKEDKDIINLDLLKEEKDISKDKTDSDAPLINLNFLKEDSDTAQNIQEDTPKQNLTLEQESVKIEEDDKESTINLNFLKIDLDENENNKENNIYKQEQKNQTPTINLNFLKDNNHDNYNHDNQDDISPEKKSQIIKQIKEDIDEIDQPIDIDTKSKDDEKSDDEIVINDALKSILKIKDDEDDKKININTPEQNQKKSTQPKEQKEVIKIKLQPPKSKIEKKAKETLFPHLNISMAQKKDILQDFIDDSTYNINLIKEYLQLDDIDSIKYIAIKIISSAKTLELSDIYQTLENIVKQDMNIQEISKIVEDISKKIENLKNLL